MNLAIVMYVAHHISQKYSEDKEGDGVVTIM